MSLSLFHGLRPLPKAGVNNPRPRKQHVLPPTLLSMQHVSICTNKNTAIHTHTHTHTHTLFSWVKSLTPKQWVLQKLQSNCISWNISGATLQKRLGSKMHTFCTVDPGYSTILEPADGKALSRTAFGVSSLGSFHLRIFLSFWHEFQGEAAKESLRKMLHHSPF